jgi:hypothetical protein
MIKITQRKLLEALKAMPDNVSVEEGMHSYVVESNDYRIHIEKPKEDFIAPSYKVLWKEYPTDSPYEAWHFSFRYAVSKMLGNLDIYG